MQREGYWYKKGSIIDITNSSHIRCIYDTPEQFGLTTTEVQETYASHNEGNTRCFLFNPIVGS
ncbi:MAG TPA: hypothetical protein P5519_00655 [Spirochaetia bacterium]|nr:hypothetical protein [Spirochaetia bacterium]